MRRVLITASAAAAAISFASPALAQSVSVDNVPGTPDAYQIYGVASDSPAQVVHGTSPKNNSPVNVTFDAGTAQDVMVTITNGFAQLDDYNATKKGTGTPDWTQIIINPDPLFTDMKFALSLTGATDATNAVNVYALLTGDTAIAGNNASLYTQLIGTIHPGAGNNINFEVSGATFNGIMLQTVNAGVTLGTLKQVSYDPAPGAVPEPATWGMMLLGFAGMGMVLRRSRRRNGALMQVA